ncbi:hypothetical protein [Granulicella rosea]|nr:hypothetical protein [Granulicella rosea]
MAEAPLPDAPLPTPAKSSEIDDAPPSSAKPANRQPCPIDPHRKATPEQLKAEEAQRIAGLVPNMNTVIGGCSPPLTAAEKWNLVYHSSVNPFVFATAFVAGGADEITGAHNGYGWGPAGYFKRVGAQYADTVTGNVIGNGLLPVLLHQDPRYFQLGAGHPFRQRVWHAAMGNFVCRSDDGKSQFNTSNIAGNFAAGAISNLYYPANERGIGLTFESATIVTLEGALGMQFLEFSPELGDLAYRVLHHGRHAPDKIPNTP